jgi:integrase
MDIYHSNDCMPLDIQRAIDCMPSRIVRKLGEIGLLSAAKTAGNNSLTDRLEGFIDSLRVKQCTEKHLSLVENKIKRVCEDCKFDVVSDLDASRFTAYVNSLNVAVKTKRDYIAVFKQFAKWLHDTGILTKNNFKLIKNPKVLKSDQVHPRRALTRNEVARLIRAAQTGETWRGISGAERALIYRLSVESGLRYNELKTLKVSDFDFKTGTVEVKDANEKSRRGDILQLKKSTAEEIKQFLSNKTPQATAFRLKKGYLMIRRDLEAADIDYEVDGRFADWHSLRHTTASLLIKSGANPKEVQRIMRHRSADLTLSKYTHLYAGQLKATIENLPDFVVEQDEAIMTGTYDCVAENRAEKNCPKTANQSEKSRTIPNNSNKIKTERNTGFNALNCKETAFSSENVTPSFPIRKIGATGLEPATS